jgi:hypothetical protein
LARAFLFSKERNGAEALAATCRDAGIAAAPCDSVVNASGDTANLSALALHLENLYDDETVLVIDADRMTAKGALHGLATALDQGTAEIILAADHRFDFPDERLARFYWKFHPRPGWPLPFASALALIGKAGGLRLMLQEATHYSGGPGTEISDVCLVNRFYADQLLGLAKVKVNVALDTAQEFLAVTDVPRTASNLAAIRRFEQDRVSGAFKAPVSRAPLHRKAEAGGRPAFLRALARTAKILALNRGEMRPRHIFRYAPNRNPEWQSAMEHFRLYLESRTPFAFVHFNDGEMTFIKQFREGDHRPNWFGRKQNRYNPDLGAHLVAALQHRQNNYFAGVPCPNCHPDLRRLADEVRPKDGMTVPAMALHHNLAHLPALLARMRDRRIFWFKNAFQDPILFRALGLSLEDTDITNVPFREAHALYGEMQGRRFPEDAIVLMSCGMLAKILIPHWFAANPRTTFLAIGSAMDDLVQRSDPNYRPYPSDLPWTGDVQGRKSFLFGRKKKACPVCFDIG